MTALFNNYVTLVFNKLKNDLCHSRVIRNLRDFVYFQNGQKPITQRRHTDDDNNKINIVEEVELVKFLFYSKV